jgi:RHS repeat-associated protein
MSIAAKHMDPIVGVDTHIILIPTPAGPVPAPLPNPYVGMVFDAMDYVPKIGATVYINGLPRAHAGTAGKQLTPHLPLGGPFGPPPPSGESEVFMGSSTVAVDGDAQSYFGLQVLSCQSIGMPAPLRPKGSPAKSLVLPTSVVLSIPMGLPVMIGGPPTISLMVLGQKALFAGLGRLGRALRKTQKGTGRLGRAMRALTRRANAAGEALANSLKLGDKARNRLARAVCTVTGHPVDVATGKVFTDHVDLELPGPLGLRWERVWYSTSTYRGPLGHGWHHAYDAALYVNPEVVLHRAPDGRLISFPALALGDEHRLANERLSLSRDREGYAIRTHDRRVYRFRDVGRANAEHVLHSITDAVGNVVTLHYDEQLRLRELVDSARRSIQFAYDAEQRLVRVSAPHPDRENERFVVVRYAYDQQGNLADVFDALDQRASYVYTRHLLSHETDRNGLTFQFEYDGQDETAKCIRTWGDRGIYDHRLRYDAVHGVTTVENSLGYKTQYEHRDGLVVRTVDANGGITQSDYDDDDRKVRETGPLRHATAWQHDARGNLLAVTGPDGASLKLRYDEKDLPVEAIDAIGGSWRFVYDDSARVIERSNPLGHRTYLAYSGKHLVAVVDPAGHGSSLEYDAMGNLRALTAPDGSLRRWKHDALGRITVAIDPAGNEQHRSYDLLGRLTRVEEPDGNVRELSCDPEGNVVHARDAQHDVRFAYQGMSRLAMRSEAGTSVRFEYDTEEQLIGIINEHGHVYRFELGPTGEVSVESGFDGIRRKYERDLAGRVRSLVRPNGLTSQYAYDDADRVTAVQHSDGSKESYDYRLDGELIQAVNDACRVAFERDALGRILRDAQDEHWVDSEYDARGLRIAMRSSLGADQRIQRNEMGDVVGLEHRSREHKEPESAFHARFTRDQFGLELERTLPGGVRSRWRRDKLGRPLQHELSVAADGKTLRAQRYDWDKDRLRAIVDAQTGPVQYGHDALGNLAWARYADTTTELRLPDAVGNLFRREDRKDRKYGPAGQLLEAEDEYGRSTSYTYDAEGNLIAKQRSSGERWRYRWGPDGMLHEVVRPDGASVTFAYDALGRRVRKSFRGQTTRWVWDGNVPLHEWVQGSLEPLVVENATPLWAADARVKQREAALCKHLLRGPPERGSAQAPITWVFEPESFSPMAKLVGDKQLSIVTDHLGTPNAMVDERGELVWRADIGVWGELRNVVGDAQACPFRWPGQYEDVETGLYYNRFRYYEPESGQYVSQDPIGLRGGSEMYAYVAEPTSQHDPFGLSCDRSNGRLLPPPRDSNPWKVGERLESSVVGPEGLIVYRAHGAGRSTGAWVTLEPPPNQRYVREQLAVHPDWNEATHVSVIKLAPGTQIQSGIAGPQNFPGGIGGGHQIQVLNREDVLQQETLQTFALQK